MMRAPRTREEIQAMLAARGLAPIHRLGQNFLVRPGAMEEIAALAAIQPGEVVLEPGPGPGGLTDALLAAGGTVIAVEIDRGLGGHLASVFAEEPRLRLVIADILGRKGELAPEVMSALEDSGAFGDPKGWSVVSNLPYQISSPFLVALALLARPPRQILVMLQAEVGEVLRAQPGTEAYSALSFLAALRFEVQALKGFGAQAFWPAPEVASAFLALRPKPLPEGLEVAVWLPIVRRLFQSRRKRLGRTFVDALSAHGGDPALASAALERAGIGGDVRIDAADPSAIVRAIALALPPR